MKKVYYNQFGWVCERAPYNIPVINRERFIEVTDQTYELTLQIHKHKAWRVVNNCLHLVRFDEMVINEEYQKEFERLLAWFEYYDNQIMQYQRAVRMNIEFDKDITELDIQAKINAEKINSLRDKLYK